MMPTLAKGPKYDPIVEVVPSWTMTTILPEVKFSHKADCHPTFHNSLLATAPGVLAHTGCSPFSVVQEPITRTEIAPGITFTQSVPDGCAAGSGVHEPPSETPTPMTSSEGSIDGKTYTFIWIATSMLLAGFMAHAFQ